MTVSLLHLLDLKINESRRTIYCHLVDVSFWIHYITKIGTAFVSLPLFLSLPVCLSTCVQLTLQGCTSRSINRYKNKPRSRFMLLFSLFCHKKMFCYLLLRSKSLLSLLNMREIFRCRFWRQSFFECIDGRLAMANVSLASIPFSFFGIPIVTVLSLKFSRTCTRILTHTHGNGRSTFFGAGKSFKRVEIFHLKFFNWCTTKTTNLHHSENSLKIRFYTLLHTQ